MSAFQYLYHGIFKRTSTTLLVVVIGAFAFERAYTDVMENLFMKLNKGKSYEEVAPKYAAIRKRKEEEEE